MLLLKITFKSEVATLSSINIRYHQHWPMPIHQSINIRYHHIDNEIVSGKSVKQKRKINTH